jgi:hypothetical protein
MANARWWSRDLQADFLFTFEHVISFHLCALPSVQYTLIKKENKFSSYIGLERLQSLFITNSLLIDD